MFALNDADVVKPEQTIAPLVQRSCARQHKRPAPVFELALDKVLAISVLPLPVGRATIRRARRSQAVSMSATVPTWYFRSVRVSWCRFHWPRRGRPRSPHWLKTSRIARSSQWACEQWKRRPEPASRLPHDVSLLRGSSAVECSVGPRTD